MICTIWDLDFTSLIVFAYINLVVLVLACQVLALV
jgi:hypothetical protein